MTGPGAPRTGTAPQSFFRAVVLGTLPLLCTSGTWALLTPGPAPGAPPLLAALETPLPPVHSPPFPSQTRLRRLDPAHPAWRRFRVRAGAAWQATLDPLTGRPRRVFGGAIPWLPGPANQLPTDQGPVGRSARVWTLEQLGRNFVETERGWLGITNDQLRLNPVATGRTGGRVQVVAFDYAPHGVPVYQGKVTFVVNQGNLIYLGTAFTAPVAADPTPALDAAAARDRARRLGVLASGSPAAGAPALVFLPYTDRGGTLAHRLVWRVPLSGPGLRERWIATLDAGDGSLVGLERTLQPSCSLNPSQLQGGVFGGVRPGRADLPEAILPMPFAHVAAGPLRVASVNGRYPFPTASSSTRLNGRYYSINCFGCENPPVIRVLADDHGDIDLGTGGVDQTGNGVTTPADRTTFFFLNLARLVAKRHLDLTWFDRFVVATTNNSTECNAFWNGTSFSFGTGGSTCRNAGEITDSIVHEWGHGLDEHDGVFPPGNSFDAATKEGMADHLSLFFTRDSCVAESLRLDPADWASTACDGSRDLDEFAGGHELGTPATLTPANVTALCPADPLFQGPLGGQGHCEGQIYGQTGYHLQQNLLTGTAYGTGAALAPGNNGYPPDAAWAIHETLFFAARPIMASYAPSTLQPFGISAYDAYLAVDDEGDGLANGTPHAAYINDAFGHHGITEAPLVPDAADRPLLPDPPMVLATTTDPVTGELTVRVSWTDVPGATAYHVLRLDAATQVPIPVATGIGPGVQEYLDSGVRNGGSYEYLVQATDPTGRLSAGLNRQGLVVLLPELELLSYTIDDVGGGNGNGLAEPGEVVNLRPTIRNLSTLSAQGIAGTLTLNGPEAFVTLPGPLSFGNIPGGGTAATTGQFQVQIQDQTILHGRVLPLTLSLAGTNGCWQDRLNLPIAGPEPVFAGQVVDDSDDAFGNGNGVPEPSETVTLRVALENRGNLAATGVSVVLAPISPGVTLVDDTADFPDLLPGALEESLAPHFRVTFAHDLVCNAVVGLSMLIVTDQGSSNGTVQLRLGQAANVGVVINEVNVGALDAVELYNPTTESISLADWRVRGRQTLVEATWQIPNFTLGPGQYVRLQEGVGPNSPTHLFFTQNFSWFPGGSGACTLLDHAGRGVDFMRWGGETQAPPPDLAWSGPDPPAPATAGETLGRDCISTDTDTGADFTIQNDTPAAVNAFCAPGSCDVVAHFKTTPNDLCDGVLVFFSDQSSGAPTTWAWDFENDGVVDSTLPNPTFTFPGVGVYQVRLTVTNGLSVDTAIRTLTVHPQPAAGFTSNSPVNDGEAVVFTNTSSGGTPPLTYRWRFGDGIEETTFEATHTYATAGTYQVDLIVTDASNCQSTFSENVVVNAAPRLLLRESFVDDTDLTTANGDLSADPGEVVTLLLRLRNIGTNSATQIVATLSTSHPEVLLVDDTATLPDLPVGATADTQAPHFLVAFEPTISCPTTAPFHLEIVTAQGTFGMDFSLPVGPQSPDHVIINEVALGAFDALELYNPTSAPVDLENWVVITDRLGASTTLVLPAFTLAPGAYVTIHETNGRDSGTDLYLGMNIEWAHGFPGSGSLIDANGDGVDFVRWGNNLTNPAPPTVWLPPDPPPPASPDVLSRTCAHQDTDRGADWTAQANSLGGANLFCPDSARCSTATPPPVRVRMIPNSLVIGTTTLAQVTGNFFQPQATVGFDDPAVTARRPDVLTSTRIEVSVEVGGSAVPGLHDVTVTNPDGKSGTGIGVLKLYTTPKTADLDGSGRVDVHDLLLLGPAFGSEIGDPAYSFEADLTSDNIIDGQDLAVLAQQFGRRF